MKKRILTGDRTTGRLHLGHYVGSLQNRVALQNDYDTMIILADVQALTTHFKTPSKVYDGIYDVAIDNLSVGLDPNQITLFQQSSVSAIAELTVFYSMLVSVNSLRHNPTIKTEAKNYGYEDLSYGFLGYPVSQAADITFCQADMIPVGDDQLPHIEQTRKIVRRFNDLYASNEHESVKVPEALLSDTPRLVGLDGHSKMGKSLGNAIYLSDEPEVVTKKIQGARTDTNRIKITDKGNPALCSVAKYHESFNKAEYHNICNMCVTATIGCSSCKRELSKKVNKMLDPIRERRSYYLQRKHRVKEIIEAGNIRANELGSETVKQVKEMMQLSL